MKKSPRNFLVITDQKFIQDINTSLKKTSRFNAVMKRMQVQVKEKENTDC